MTTTSITKPRGDTSNLWFTAAERILIDRATQSAGKTRTNFILDAARRAAEGELLDRALMVVSPDAYAAFLKLLNAPPTPNKRLRRMMQAQAPWKTA